MQCDDGGEGAGAVGAGQLAGQSDGSALEIRYRELDDLNVSVVTIKRSAKRDVRLFAKIYRFLAESEPHIVHTWSTMSSIYTSPTAFLQGIKIVNGMIRSAHTDMGWRDQRWIRARLTFPFADAIVSNTREGLKAFGAPSCKSLCIYNGFDFTRITALETQNTIKERWDIKTDFTVGMVASFSEYKDYDTFIGAAVRILKERDDVTFVAIGDGKHRMRVAQQIPDCCLGRIKFLGRIQDVESVINTFDIGVLMTNTRLHGEGISNAILEYMALGKPVIATDYGGNRESIANGRTGFMVPAGNDNELAAKINMLLNNRTMAACMGREGRRMVKKLFDNEKMTEQYFRLYMRLAGRTIR